MNNKESIFDQIEGLKKIDEKELADFEQEMTDNVIPELVDIIEERLMLAEESRFREIEVLVERYK